MTRFEALSDLQFRFMEQHEQLAPNVFRTAFSNGAEIICNYTDSDYVHKGQTIATQPLPAVQMNTNWVSRQCE